MKVDKKGHTTIIRNTQGDVKSFLDRISAEHNIYASQNLILDISSIKDLSLAEVKLFSELSALHKKGKKSLVLVADGIDFNAVPAKLVVVPSLLEAHDIIELDEIERDLGF